MDRNELPLPIKIYARILSAGRIYSGATQLSFNRIVNKMLAHARSPVRARLLNGKEISVDIHDYNGRVLYFFGTTDPKVHAVTQALLRPGDRFLDIGANYSAIGLLAADRVGPLGAVHLFEPQADIADRVEEAIRAAGMTNVTMHRIGLLDRDGEATLARYDGNSGMATFFEHGDQRAAERTPVPIRDVATYLPPLVGPHPFGVKLDVEGAEPALLRWLARQPNLRFVVFEAARNRRELFRIVDGAGLRLYGLHRIIFRSEVRRVDTPDDMAPYHDLVAFRAPAGLRLPERVRPSTLARLLAGH